MFGGLAALAALLAVPCAANAASLSVTPGVPARGAQVTIAASGFSLPPKARTKSTASGFIRRLSGFICPPGSTSAS